MSPPRSSSALVAVVLVGSLGSTFVDADAPRTPPDMAEQSCSLNKRFCLLRAERSGPLRLFEVAPSGRRTPRWETRDSASGFMIADDGEHWVSLQEDANLLRLDAPETSVMLTFHRRGEMIARVMLRQVIEHPNDLPRSVSHRIWARAYGFEKGVFILHTAESAEFRFDFHTGKPLNRSFFR